MESISNVFQEFGYNTQRSGSSHELQSLNTRVHGRFHSKFCSIKIILLWNSWMPVEMARRLFPSDEIAWNKNLVHIKWLVSFRSLWKFLSNYTR